MFPSWKEELRMLSWEGIWQKKLRVKEWTVIFLMFRFFLFFDFSFFSSLKPAGPLCFKLRMLSWKGIRQKFKVKK